MQYINVPDALPKNVYHATFFSRLYNHALGYCVYLPAVAGEKSCPVHYHFHGWQGQECSDVLAMETVYQSGETIFVFPNVSYELEGTADLPVERMFFEELIPEIERKYRSSGKRSISGFSMGGGMAVWFALRHPAAFAEVTAYAGTFHHYYHPEYGTAFVPVERAEELYRGMLQAKWESEKKSAGAVECRCERCIPANLASWHAGSSVLRCGSAAPASAVPGFSAYLCMHQRRGAFTGRN